MSTHNDRMEIHGRVCNGVVVLEDGASLPEGAEVTVSYGPAPIENAPAAKRRIEVPLVRTGEPGTLHLTGERIAQILDLGDASHRRSGVEAEQP
jgi:hypothetical protein